MPILIRFSGRKSYIFASEPRESQPSLYHYNPLHFLHAFKHDINDEEIHTR